MSATGFPINGERPTARWCELAAELTILSEQLRAGAAGRRVIPFDDGRRAHAAAVAGSRESRRYRIYTVRS